MNSTQKPVIWARKDRKNALDDLLRLSSGEGDPIYRLIRSGQLELFLSDPAGQRGRFVGIPNGKTGIEKKPLETWPVHPATYSALARLVRACRGRYDVPQEEQDA